MKILYKDSKIKKICCDEKIAIRKFGQDVAKRLMFVINFMGNSKDLNDLLALKQYHLHQLKGNRLGEYSIYLGKTTGFRLIIIPLDENENRIQVNDMSIYTKSVCVEIEEVSKHYE